MISLTWTGAAENAVPPSRSCVKKGAASQHCKQSTLKSTIDIILMWLFYYLESWGRNWTRTSLARGRRGRTEPESCVQKDVPINCPFKRGVDSTKCFITKCRPNNIPLYAVFLVFRNNIVGRCSVGRHFVEPAKGRHFMEASCKKHKTAGISLFTVL